MIGGVAGGATGGDTGAASGAAALRDFAADGRDRRGDGQRRGQRALARTIAGAGRQRVMGAGWRATRWRSGRPPRRSRASRRELDVLNPEAHHGGLSRDGELASPIAEEGDAGGGRLTQSFQTWTDVPVYQYHQYFDWNFYVKPYEGYLHTASWASVHAIPGTEGANAAPDVPEMECRWDTGAFSGPVGNASTRPRPPGAAPESDGAMFRGWIWRGRWRGSRCGWRGAGCSTAATATRCAAPTGGSWRRRRRGVQSQRMRLELHPVKAVASARHEGVRFTENQDFYAPGVRLHVLRQPLRGLLRLRADQPEGLRVHRRPAAAARRRVAAVDGRGPPSLPNRKVLVGSSQGSHGTEGVGQNTDVAGRGTRLLMRFDTAPYESVMRGKKAAIRPRVQPIPITGTAWVRDQVKVTIPLSEAAPDDDAYGVIIEFAWLDGRDLSAVRKVKRFTVTFHSVEKLDNYSHNIAGDIPISLEGSCEEWRVRYGSTAAGPSRRDRAQRRGRLSLGDRQFTVYLNTDEQAPDQLTVCCHGTEHDEVEDIFRRAAGPPRRQARRVTLTHGTSSTVPTTTSEGRSPARSTASSGTRWPTPPTRSGACSR